MSEAVFEPGAVAARRAAYASAAPFPHVVIPGLCDEARARAVFAEAKTALRADYKVGQPLWHASAIR